MFFVITNYFFYDSICIKYISVYMQPTCRVRIYIQGTFNYVYSICILIYSLNTHTIPLHKIHIYEYISNVHMLMYILNVHTQYASLICTSNTFIIMNIQCIFFNMIIMYIEYYTSNAHLVYIHLICLIICTLNEHWAMCIVCALVYVHKQVHKNVNTGYIYTNAHTVYIYKRAFVVHCILHIQCAL